MDINLGNINDVLNGMMSGGRVGAPPDFPHLRGKTKEELEQMLDENLYHQQQGDRDISDLWDEEDAIKRELESR